PGGPCSERIPLHSVGGSSRDGPTSPVVGSPGREFSLLRDDFLRAGLTGSSPARTDGFVGLVSIPSGRRSGAEGVGVGLLTGASTRLVVFGEQSSSRIFVNSDDPPP